MVPASDRRFDGIREDLTLLMVAVERTIAEMQRRTELQLLRADEAVRERAREKYGAKAWQALLTDSERDLVKAWVACNP